ncbi:cellulose binding domain-containing protein [Lentzea sp. DG1S-22]|uniref:cellulose binding domain-containing protein n=1 Tax=Lentzea sp. DG1S-22 TaxID=3108822 RepID=UPI002E77F7F3|nr:cellulose binding domain-containing protein [Lentzea sp. DG1S-22]WVH80561.1 cellulose binding domain-containing protein [Lentzea sp. DG1S-22]
MVRKSLSLLLVLLVCGCTVEGQSRPVTAPVQLQVPTLVNDSRGDVAAVVRAVVDGRTIELDSGERVRISLLAAPAGCWAAQARAFAEKTLVGKPVRVSAVTPGEVNVRLEDDTDYAALAVREGVLRAQDAAGSLSDAELGAARADRGLWGAPCNGMDVAPTTTTVPPSSQRAEPSTSVATTSAAAPSVPVTTTAPPAPTCSVAYRVDEQWQGGFRSRITIRNTGAAAIGGWTLRWSFADGQSVREMWGATASQRGTAVTATSVDHTKTIPAPGEVTIGFIGAFRDRNTAPSSFTLNGTACATS